MSEAMSDSKRIAEAHDAGVRKKALEDARVAILKGWDADRGDGERRPDYSKATWQKAMDALAACK